LTLDLFSAARMDREPEASSGSAETPGRRAYSVSDVNRLVRQLLEGRVPPLWVAGEVTNWKRYASGHCYFSLRDAQAQLRCVMFRNEAAQLPTDPEEGMKVRALGRVTVYEKRGDFQLIVDALEGEGGRPAGPGTQTAAAALPAAGGGGHLGGGRGPARHPPGDRAACAVDDGGAVCGACTG
jgi:hypothetical protein